VKTVFAAAPATDPFGSFLESVRSHPGLDLVGVGTTRRETVEAMRRHNLDVLVFADEYADLARVVRMSARPTSDGWPAMVLAAAERTDSVVVRSLLYGFDDVIALDRDAAGNLARSTEVDDGPGTPPLESSMQRLAVLRGLLARDLVTPESRDVEVADLVGVGLDDREIAAVMSITVQEVRNRVEGLLHANRLPSRTHLAVLRAGRVIVPDFA